MPLNPKETASLKSIRSELDRLKEANPGLAAELSDVLTLLDDFAAAGDANSIDNIRAARSARRAG